MIARLVALAAVGAVACGSGHPAPPPGPPGPPPAVTETAPRGRVETHRFHSDALGVDKAYVVYLPAGYDDGDRRWPVFYYLHGLGGNETDWLKGGAIDQAADALHLAAIVVMPDGDDDFYTDAPMPIDYAACMAKGEGLLDPREPHARTCVRHRAYETYILRDLIGHVDATYRTLARRESRAIAGLSMGGYGAFALALRHPEVFTAAASHSGVLSLRYGGPHPYRASEVKVADDIGRLAAGMGPLGAWILGMFGTDLDGVKAHDPATLVQALAPGTLALYLDCGTEDDFGLDAGASYVHDLLTARHVEHAFFLGPGAHNFGFWKSRVASSLAFLRDHVAPQGR